MLTYGKRKTVFFAFICILILGVLTGRMVYLMVFRSEYLTDNALEVQQRERQIKAARGLIMDRNGTVIATNVTVCTISVINSQITDSNKVIEVLSDELGMTEDEVRKKVEKVSVREKIKSNVDKEVGDKIRSYNLDGVKVDEDYKRYYPYSSMASKVIGFTGSDNQGIIGLEVQYEKYLKGVNGSILTVTDSQGIEIDGIEESRIEGVPGNNLKISLDVNIQLYATQIATKVLEAKQANYVSIIVMNPKNGEIYATVNCPEFDLNDPYELNYVLEEEVDDEAYNDLLNGMWRNQSINDTYEPGSTFKIFTATAGLELGVVSIEDTFHCPGYAVVEDRRIRCHKVIGHGSENFLQGTMNSCNPVFIEVGSRVGVTNFFLYLDKLGFLKKTGIDLPGEANTIIHKEENVGPVELATMSFGQSFQITPIQLLASASAIINGGNSVVPHFGMEVSNADNEIIKTFEYPTTSGIVSTKTSETMRYILEQVVENGTGKRTYIEGFRIGGKTATSQKLPRSAAKYIASFIAFAPADDPEVIAMVIIDEPQGIYYGGTICGPVMKELFENVLPYLKLGE